MTSFPIVPDVAVISPLTFTLFAYNAPAFVTPNVLPAVKHHPDIVPDPPIDFDDAEPVHTSTLLSVPQVPLLIELLSMSKPPIFAEMACRLSTLILSAVILPVVILPPLMVVVPDVYILSAIPCALLFAVCPSARYSMLCRVPVVGAAV